MGELVCGKPKQLLDEGFHSIPGGGIRRYVTELGHPPVPVLRHRTGVRHVAGFHAIVGQNIVFQPIEV